MDNLTHSLVGALLGQMGLKRKTGLAMPTLIIAANLPDIDAVAVLLGGHQHLAIRRGITHGPVAMLLLPLLLWAAMLAWDKWRPSDKRLPVHKGWLFALAYIGCLSHPLFDWFNSYGIRLLEPFSSRWFYGDTLFIIDIWIWAAAIFGFCLSLRRERAGRKHWQRPAKTAFLVICGYIFANGAITATAKDAALKQLRSGNSPTVIIRDPVVVANPVPLAFWRRELLWRDAEHYGFGSFSIGYGAKFQTEHRAHNMRTKAVRRFTDSPFRDAKPFLFWSRMPVGNVNDTVLTLKDQRFMNSPADSNFTAKAEFYE